MSIPNFDLDDVSFQQLVDEAIKKISKVSNQWTNYNLSDPGITLLELFAFLADNQIYVLNKITKNHYIKFLKLLGIRPKENVLPVVELSLFANRMNFVPSSPQSPPSFPTTTTRNSTIDLTKNTRFVSKKENIFVETSEDFNFIPSLRFSKCLTFSNNQFVENDITGVNLPNLNIQPNTDSFVSQKISDNTNIKNLFFLNKKKDGISPPFFFVFGQNPKENDTFFLCLEFNLKEINENKKEILIYFKIYDKDLPPLGKHGDESFEEFADKNYYSIIKWEYYFEGNDNDSDNLALKNPKSIFDFTQSDWKPLELSMDNTNSFSQTGKIHFKIPGNFEGIDKKTVVKMWIRATLKSNNYFIPPRIESILCNTVSSTMGITTEQLLKNKSSVLSESTWIDENPYLVDNTVNPTLLSNGFANQIFQIDDVTKLPILIIQSLKIEYINNDRKKVVEEWTQVYDFDSSFPFDKHFVVVDKKNGIFKFGDGENGKIPPIGSKVILKYKTGNLKDNLIINEGKIFEIDSISKSTGTPFQNRLPPEIFGINIHPSTLGTLDEDIKETVIRARTELSTPFKIVSKRDCEYIAKNTPGVRVGKIKVLTNNEVNGYVAVLDIQGNNLDIEYIGEPENLENTLFVSAIPYTFSKIPVINLQFLNTILKHLEKHRLITTKIKMVVPEYVKISATASVKLSNQLIDKQKIRKKIYDVLDYVFRPLPSSFQNREFEGWEFGKDIYKSEIITNIEKIEEVDSVLNIVLNATGSYGSFKKDNGGNILINNLNLVILDKVDISFIQ